jgi:hypothetical protein
MVAERSADIDSIHDFALARSILDLAEAGRIGSP